MLQAEIRRKSMLITTTPPNTIVDKTHHHWAERIVSRALDNLNNMVMLNIHINSELINMQTRLK